jgi:hypothetical protein
MVAIQSFHHNTNNFLLVGQDAHQGQHYHLRPLWPGRYPVPSPSFKCEVCMRAKKQRRRKGHSNSSIDVGYTENFPDFFHFLLILTQYNSQNKTHKRRNTTL